MDINIISNLDSIASEHIQLDLPDIAKPRILIASLIRNLSQEHPNKIIILGIRFIGQRIVKLDASLDKFIKLLSGRRHRIYYGIGFNKKIYINFSWHKLKSFSKQEMEFIKNNINAEFFENSVIKPNSHNGVFLIKKTGVCKLENCIYKVAPNLFINNEIINK
jgi:hypothetical protein